MPGLNQEECLEFCEETCRQKAGEIITSVNELINQTVDGNPVMADSLRLKIARYLIKDSQYRIVSDDKLVTLEMAPTVLPNGKEIDLWQAIADDRKVIDVRANTGKYLSLEVNDVVCFQRSSDGAQILRRIGLIFRVDGLEQLVKRIVATGLFYGDHTTREQRVISHIIPGLETLGELIQATNSFPGNTEKIKRYGVVALVLMPLTPKEFAEHKLKQLGWREETTSTGARVFTWSADARVKDWKERVRERQIQEEKDFTEFSDHIGVIEGG